MQVYQSACFSIISYSMYKCSKKHTLFPIISFDSAMELQAAHKVKILTSSFIYAVQLFIYYLIVLPLLFYTDIKNAHA